MPSKIKVGTPVIITRDPPGLIAEAIEENKEGLIKEIETALHP